MGDRSNSQKCRQFSGWVNKYCSDAKVSLSVVDDMFVCKECQEANDGDGTDVQESMELGGKLRVPGQSSIILLPLGYGEY